MAQAAPKEPATPAMDWVPPQAMEDTLRAEGGEVTIPEITITPTPKVTADTAKFTKEYRIDPAKFGIFTDCTHAAETSKGLNAALQDAKTVGANHIIFPKGTFLIDENDPIILDHQNTIVDLNAAILQIQTNGLPKYSIVVIVNGAKNLRLTNGTLSGDRRSHDYKTVPGTHEWGGGVRFASGLGVEVDHLTITNMTGDGVATEVFGTRTRPEMLARIFYSIMAKDIESGGFSEKGEKIPTPDKVRSIAPYDLSKTGGEFEIGYMAGYMGFPFIKSRVYQVYFLDADKRFLEKQAVLQYRKVKLPPNARFAYLEFNQSEVSDEPAHAGAAKGSWLVRITNTASPRDVHLHDNLIISNRRLGLAFTGGQRWLIENNRFEYNGGTNPAYGVDFEDGAEMMQDVVFRKNSFKDNVNGDLVVCAGTELLFEDNIFQKSVVFWGRPHNYVFHRNQFNGGSVIYATRTGIATIRDNVYKNCKVKVKFDTKAVADGIDREPGHAVSTPALLLQNETMDNVPVVEGTYLNFKDSRFTNTTFRVDDLTKMVKFEGCTFEDSTIDYSEKGPGLPVSVKNNRGTLAETGGGLSRKNSQPTP
ncbi:hypothetical protein BH09VER1_BH09VER1_08340 [soil metagenome]